MPMEWLNIHLIYTMNVSEENLTEPIWIALYYEINPLFVKEDYFTPQYQDSKVLFDKLLNMSKVERGYSYS
jgi:hypothetical protein